MKKKIYRSVSDKKIAGVCGGLGEYLNIDSTIIRIVWALLILVKGVGLVAYLICALIIPVDVEPPTTTQDFEKKDAVDVEYTEKPTSDANEQKTEN